MCAVVVRCEEAPSPSYSADTTLILPTGLPGMIHQVYIATPIAFKGGQLDNKVASNIHVRGHPIAGNCSEEDLAINHGGGGGGGGSSTSTVRPSLTSPTPSRVYKRAQQPRTTECSQQQYSALPSPSCGKIALQEVLSIMPKRLLPPYPCIGHHSPPSPSAACFRCAPSRESIDKSPFWPSKGTQCRCLW